MFGGYYKDPEATAEVLGADGWLRSGDIAEIDADGFVKITDRKKDIIVTAGGKNIAPQNIENDLKASKYISQALVVGDRRPYPAALVTLDAVEIGKWAEAQGIPAEMADAGRRRAGARPRAGASSTTSTATGHGSSRSSGSRSCRATSRSNPDEVTPTLKLKRRAVMQHFAEAVDALYRERGYGARRARSATGGGRRRSRRARSCSRS